MVKHDRRRAASSFTDFRGAMKRKCPRCGASPGYPCVRLRGTGVSGVEGTQGAYLVTLKTTHKERRKPQ